MGRTAEQRNQTPAPKQALHNPVVSNAGTELHSDDFKIQQKPNIELSLDREIPRGEDDLIAVGIDLGHKEYQDELAFAEEPVVIRIEPSREKHAPRVVDCWVQGKGAEVFTNGKWISLGYLPIGVEIITRRKYVEVLARAKADSIETIAPTGFDIMAGREDQNNVARRTSLLYPFSVIRDENPRGHAWLTKIMAEF